jgi:hypothetical protein
MHAAEAFVPDSWMYRIPDPESPTRASRGYIQELCNIVERDSIERRSRWSVEVSSAPYPRPVWAHRAHADQRAEAFVVTMGAMKLWESGP